MKNLLAAALLALGLMNAAPARAAAIDCTQLATGVGLCIPKYGTSFDNWARAEIAVFTLLNSSSVIQSTSAAFNLGWVRTHRISGHATDEAGIWISSATTFSSSSTWTAPEGIRIVYHADLGSATVRAGLTVVGTTTLQGLVSGITMTSATVQSGFYMAAGNAGFGTATPTNSGGFTTLAVNGSTGGQLDFQTGGVSKQYIYSSATDLTHYNTNGGHRFWNGTEQLYIAQNGAISMPGSVTIGSGTAQGGAQISGDYYSTVRVLPSAGATKGVSLGYNNASDFGIIAPWSTAGLQFWTYNGSAWAARMAINASGAVAVVGITSGLSLNVQQGFVQIGDDNSAASPSLNFGGRNHGFFSAASSLGLSISGVQTTQFADTSTTFFGSTVTVAKTGIFSAPSQPGASARQVSSQLLGNGTYDQQYFGDAACAAGCYSRGGVWGGSPSSGTFTTNGAGLYRLGCQMVFTGHAAGTLLTVMVSDDDANTNVFAQKQWIAGTTNTLVDGINGAAVYLPDAQALQCNVRADTAGVTANGSLQARFTVQKDW